MVAVAMMEMKVLEFVITCNGAINALGICVAVKQCRPSASVAFFDDVLNVFVLATVFALINLHMKGLTVLKD
jgi:hypothetical protein